MAVQTKKLYLPKEVIDKVQELFPNSKAKVKNSLLFIDRLISKSQNKYGIIDCAINYSTSYFREVYSSRYLDWLNPLIESKIINRNDYYSYKNSISKSYSFLPPSSPPIFVTTFSITTSVTNLKPTTCFKYFYNDFSSLNLDINELKKLCKTASEKIDFSKISINEDIMSSVVNLVKLNGYKNWLPKEFALDIAKSENKDLIQDGKYCYIEKFETYLENKRLSRHIAYLRSLKRLEEKSFYAKRNSTNNRLDTNLTNLPSILTNKICEDNDLVQIDLVNAQFAIMSKLYDDLNCKDDLNRFKELCYSGKIYEFLQTTFNLQSRDEAKKITFELIFSKVENESKIKDKLKEIFPSLVLKTDEFKKTNGYKQLAISMQKLEAEIFIDGLHKNIKKAKKFCLTKHDSLIIRRKDQDFVMKIISSHFEEIDFKGKVAIS